MGLANSTVHMLLPLLRRLQKLLYLFTRLFQGIKRSKYLGHRGNGVPELDYGLCSENIVYAVSTKRGVEFLQ